MSYYDKIYGLVRRIPAGKCASYGQLALLSGSPRAARVVGSALRLCKEDAVPCHRVLRSDGSVTCAFPPGLQRALLEAEGVAFTPGGKVDWSQCGWERYAKVRLCLGRGTLRQREESRWRVRKVQGGERTAFLIERLHQKDKNIQLVGLGRAPKFLHVLDERIGKQSAVRCKERAHDLPFRCILALQLEQELLGLRVLALEQTFVEADFQGKTYFPPFLQPLVGSGRGAFGSCGGLFTAESRPLRVQKGQRRRQVAAEHGGGKAVQL